MHEPANAPVEARELRSAPATTPSPMTHESSTAFFPVTHEPQPAPSPVRHESPPAPSPVRHEPPPAHEPDPAAIERALRESGLEMVQTRASGPIELPPDAEFVPAKRERRPPPVDIDEPLVQVQTGRDSSEPKP